MAVRVPIPIFAAFLCVLAAATPGRAANPEVPAGGFRGLLHDLENLFEFRGSDRGGDGLAVLRQRLEDKWTPPKDHCALLLQVADLEAARGNFRQAIKDMQAHIGGCELTDADKRKSFKFLGRLYLAVQPPEFDRAIEFLRKASDGGKNPDPDVYLYLGGALAITGRYDEAVVEARRAIDLAEEPREDDYRLLVFCHVMRKDYKEVAPLLEMMAELFPLRDDYLFTLALAYHELGLDRPAFLVQSFRYTLGYLNTEAELMGMADLYLVQGNPDRAARLLDKAIRNGRVRHSAHSLTKLADVRSLAREHEKAWHALAEAAAESSTSDLEFRVALTHFQDDDWDRAEKYLRRALRKGGPCMAHVLLGYTLYYKDDDFGALRQFEAARIAGCKEEADRSLRSIATEIAGPMNGLLFRRIAAAAAKDDRARTASRQALGAARKAAAARQADIRRDWLAAFERDEGTVRRYLDRGAVEEAREDRATMELLIAGLPADRLTPKALARARRLHRLSRRRVAVLEAAQSDLEQAAGVADRTRAKLAASSGP